MEKILSETRVRRERRKESDENQLARVEVRDRRIPRKRNETFADSLMAISLLPAGRYSL